MIILYGCGIYGTKVAYAKAKGEYQSRYDTLAKLYEGVDGANIDAELTADLVDDYLFADTDFISRLSTENRNVFQKIYDEVKHLLKLATAGSKEARELERVKHLFDKAFRDTATKNTTEDGGVKLSVTLGKLADINVNVEAEIEPYGIKSSTIMLEFKTRFITN